MSGEEATTAMSVRARRVNTQPGTRLAAMSAPARYPTVRGFLRSSHQWFGATQHKSYAAEPSRRISLTCGAGEQRWPLAGPGVAGGMKTSCD